MRAIIVEGTEEEIAALVIETRERRFEVSETKPPEEKSEGDRLVSR